MDNFIADKTKKQVLVISNDTFYHLYCEEELLDEANKAEVDMIISNFPNGFYIEDNYKFLDNTGQVEIEIIPYTAVNTDFDEYCQLTSNMQLQIKWVDNTNIIAHLLDTETGIRTHYGNFKVYVNKFGNKCFHTGNQDEDFVTGKMSLYFLKHFKKV